MSDSQAHFRAPAPFYVNTRSLAAAAVQDTPVESDMTEKSTAEEAFSGAPASQPEDALPAVKERPVEEEREMFFYYPKYLDPDAVAAIARSLLQQWEKPTS